MISNYTRWMKSAGVLAMSVCATAAFAQAEAPASPELGGKPEVEKVVIAPAPETPAAVSEATPSSGPATAVEPDKSTKKTIEQRVDGTQTQRAIKVPPKPKKNVQRIDNIPNKPKVVPKAVIKGPVSPWGYAARYSAGEVVRPSAKDMQGKSDQPGIAGAGAGGQPGSTGSLSGSSRRAERRAER